MRRSLALQAFDGWDIPNVIDPEPSPDAIRLAYEEIRVQVAAATSLQPPSGRYNCHGLVFGSRRVNIDSAGAPVDVLDLLRRDGYRRLGPRPPQVGDVAVYVVRNFDRDRAVHTGFVTRVVPAEPPELAPPTIHVWSKWGGLGEFEHRAESFIRVDVIEYWRLRP